MIQEQLACGCMDAVPKQLDGEHHVIMMIIFTSKAADSFIYFPGLFFSHLTHSAGDHAQSLAVGPWEM